MKSLSNLLEFHPNMCIICTHFGCMVLENKQAWTVLWVAGLMPVLPFPQPWSKQIFWFFDDWSPTYYHTKTGMIGNGARAGVMGKRHSRKSLFQLSVETKEKKNEAYLTRRGSYGIQAKISGVLALATWRSAHEDSTYCESWNNWESR